MPRNHLLSLVATLALGSPALFAAYEPSGDVGRCLRKEYAEIVKNSPLANSRLSSYSVGWWTGWYYFSATAQKDFYLYAHRSADQLGHQYRAGDEFSGHFAIVVDNTFLLKNGKRVPAGLTCRFVRDSISEMSLAMSLIDRDGNQIGAIPGTVPYHPVGACFPAGVSIATPGGPVAIEQVEVGQIVYAMDDAGTLIAAPVEKTFVHEQIPLLEVEMEADGKTMTLRTTAEHPFFRAENGREIVKARDLKSGDHLYHFDNGGVRSNVTVVKVRHSHDIARVYNFSVNQYHNYFADGILVHNFK